MITNEIERRLVASYTTKKIYYTHHPRIHYNIDVDNLNGGKVAEIITAWLISGKSSSGSDKRLRKLQYQLEEQRNHNNIITRKLEAEIEELRANCNRLRREKAKLEEGGYNRNEANRIAKNLFGFAQKAESNDVLPRRPANFGDTVRIENERKNKQKIDDNFREQKIKQREEEKKDAKLQEYREQRDIDNLKNNNISSIKRRETMRDRQTQQEPNGVNRILGPPRTAASVLGPRTPAPANRRSGRVLARNRRPGLIPEFIKGCNIF